MLKHHPHRDSIPQEIEDPEDSTIIGPAQGEVFEDDDENVNDARFPNATKSNNNMSTSSVVVAPPPENASRASEKIMPGSSVLPGTTSNSGDAAAASTVVKPQQTIDLSQIPREVRSLLAGGIAGMVAKSVVAPMDRIKILYQVSSAEFHFRSLPQVVRNIVQTEGLAALWKGNTATMIRVFPYSGIQFMVFDRCKRFFLKEHEQGRYILSTNSRRPTEPSSLKSQKHGLTALESLVGGMMAGTVSVVCTYPLDLTRAQLAVLKTHKHHHTIGTGPAVSASTTAHAVKTKGFASVLIENYTQRGMAGLFRGISPTLLGILPYSGVAFTLNEQGKREIESLTKRDLTTMERMQCGAFAGLVAQTATYPIEVTRRRMQTLGVVGNDTAMDCLTKNNPSAAPGHRVGGVIAPPPARPESLADTIRHLYAEQGIRGFFKGVSVNWMKGPIAFSISFTTFDTVQGLMEPRAPHSSQSQ